MKNQYDGHGGSYVVDAAGELSLVERTKEASESAPAPAEPPDPAEHEAHDEPAAAGFFSPVADDDGQTTTME